MALRWGSKYLIFWSPKREKNGSEEQKERRRGRRRGRRRREEEEKRSKGKLRYGTWDFCMELYGFVWISCLDMCLWVVGCRKPNPRMNLCIEIITNPFVSLGFLL